MKKKHVKIIDDKERCEELAIKQNEFDKMIKKASQIKVEVKSSKDVKDKKCRNKALIFQNT
jgi:hypothetical protein